MNHWKIVTRETKRRFPDAGNGLREHVEEFGGETRERADALLDQAKIYGAELLALAARHGVEAVRDYGLPALTRPRRRRHSGWKWGLIAAGAAAIAILYLAAPTD